MQTVRVYDPERVPQHWRQLIQPSQFVAFTTDIATGAPCDVDGNRFVSTDAITCVIFDSIDEAVAFCRARAEAAPTVRFDIFDAAGRTSPPRVSVSHEDRAGGSRRRRFSGWISYAFALLLIIAAPFLIWYDWAKHDGLLVLPTILGINCLLIAGRLLQLNLTELFAERARRKRLAEYTDVHGR